MSFSNVGKVWDQESFREYLSTIPDKELSWAKGVTIHHTAYPDQAMRPKGFTIQHMRNIQYGYENNKGWSRGPHLFTDEDQIFGMTPLTEKGIHAVAFNSSHIGIEALGDYDYNDDPKTGRGAQIMRVTIDAAALLLEKLGLPANESTITFHRDDPETSKTCPGKKIDKKEFVAKVASAMETRGEEPEEPEDTSGVAAFVIECCNSIIWQANKIIKKLSE